MSRGRRKDAIKNLCTIRGFSPDDAYIVEEINAIDIQLEHDRTAVGDGSWAPFKQVFTQWHLFKHLLLCTSLFMFQNGTSVNAINCKRLSDRSLAVPAARWGSALISRLKAPSPRSQDRCLASPRC
jgi:hypothetical protein